MGRCGVWALACVAGCSAGDGLGETDGAGLGGSMGATATGAESNEDGASESETTGDSTTAEASDDESSAGSSGIPEGCQNNYVDPGEQCDDGNDVNADGCNRDCRSSAQLLWSVSHGAGVGQVDEGFAVVALDDGAAVIAGYVSDAAEARDGWIRAYDSTGVELWTDALAGAGGGNDEIRGLISDGMGNVYATGYESAAESADAWVRKYDALGNALWTQTYDGPNHATDVYDAATIDADGNIVVAGYHNTPDEGYDVLLRKYDPDGNVLWTRSSSGENGGTDLIWDIEPSPAGHLYVAGYAAGPAGEGSNAWLAKYDADGNELWDRSYNGDASLDDYLIGVEVLDDDDVIVCGYMNEVDIPWRVTVRRYDSAGMLVWADDHAGDSGGGAHCFGIEVDGDGNAVTTGGEMVAKVRGVMVRKYDPEGDVLWSTVLPSPALGPDYGRRVSIGDGDEIFIAGAMDVGPDVRDIWLGVLTP